MPATTVVILIVTVMFNHPGLDPRPVEIPFPMPDLATCEAKGRALAATSDATRTLRFVCREGA